MSESDDLERIVTHLAYDFIDYFDSHLSKPLSKKVPPHQKLSVVVDVLKNTVSPNIVDFKLLTDLPARYSKELFRYVVRNGLNRKKIEKAILNIIVTDIIGVVNARYDCTVSIVYAGVLHDKHVISYTKEKDYPDIRLPL